jgi:hypothetical protein
MHDERIRRGVVSSRHYLRREPHRHRKLPARRAGQATGDGVSAAAPVRLCSARKRNGDPCRNPPMCGRDVCSSHAGKTGRKSILNPKLQDRFLRGLASGVGVAEAATYAGIGRSTAHAWLDRAEKEQAAGITAKTSEYVAFLDGITRTRAMVRVELAAQLRAAAVRETKGDWRAAAWMLERLAPAEFGRHATVQHEHSQTGHVSEELLGGRQPVDIPWKTRQAIIALIDEAEAEATAGDAEGL